MLPSTLSVQKELNPPSPISAGGARSTLISVVTLTLLTTLAAGLRFFALARKPFWLDECFSVEVARLSWHDFAFLLWRREANMALYYLLLRGWLSFGSTPYFIRSLSVIFSLAAVPAIFWLGSHLFDRRVGLIAAALLSVNAYHIRYAQEARSYSLFCLLAILSSGFLVATLRRDSRRSWIGYVVSSVLAVYAHLYALLLIGAQWLAVRKQGAEHALRPKPEPALSAGFRGPASAKSWPSPSISAATVAWFFFCSMPQPARPPWCRESFGGAREAGRPQAAALGMAAIGMPGGCVFF
jgi:uncharacterized membrane protein